jgi:hypothetical protein
VVVKLIAVRTIVEGFVKAGPEGDIIDLDAMVKVKVGYVEAGWMCESRWRGSC